MEEQKVYLFVETPFSFQKPKARLLLPMLFSLVVYVAMVAVFWIKMPEKAVYITPVMAGAFLLSCLGIAVYRLSYVTLEDGYLVCRCFGIRVRRIFLNSRLRAKVAGSQLQVLSGSAVLLSVPDSEAARRLMTAAHICMAP